MLKLFVESISKKKSDSSLTKTGFSSHNIPKKISKGKIKEIEPPFPRSIGGEHQDTCSDYASHVSEEPKIRSLFIWCHDEELQKLNLTLSLTRMIFRNWGGQTISHGVKEIPLSDNFKPFKLNFYDGERSPKQYLYYFKSQMGLIVGNDLTMAHVFANTLTCLTL